MERYLPTQHREAGQSLIEVLFGLTLAVMAISTIGYLFLSSQTNARAVSEHTQALGLVHEGLAAVEAIAQENFSLLVPGTYGLARSASGFQLEGSTDATGKYVRTITLEQLGGGTMSVLSEVTWPVFGGRDGYVKAVGVVSNWRQNAGEAAAISVDLSGLGYGTGGQIVEGTTLIVSDPVSVEGLVFHWDSAARLASSSLSGVKVFSASGTDPLPSGTEITFSPIALASGEVNFGPHAFTADMRGVPLMAEVRLEDGSTRYVRITQ